MELNTNFSEKIIALMHKMGVQRTIDKSTILLREGDTEHHLYYVHSGALRVYLLNEFEEMTIRFGYEGSIINSLSSFISGSPSELYIESIRRTEIYCLTKERLYQLVYENETNLKAYLQLIETLICQQIEREIDLLTVSPAERLKRVLSRSPNLFQQIPLKYIASYLRMTPETLSRIRNS